MTQKEKIEISKDIIEKIKQRIKETEFKSVEEYIEFVLREVLEEEEAEISKEDEEIIKERLRALGYL